MPQAEQPGTRRPAPTPSGSKRGPPTSINKQPGTQPARSPTINGAIGGHHRPAGPDLLGPCAHEAPDLPPPGRAIPQCNMAEGKGLDGVGDAREGPQVVGAFRLGSRLSRVPVSQPCPRAISRLRVVGARGAGLGRCEGRESAPLGRDGAPPPGPSVPPPPFSARPRQSLSKGDRGSTGKDSAGFRNVEIRLGAATAASGERGPSGARGGARGEGADPGPRAGARARGPSARRPIPSQPGELSR